MESELKLDEPILHRVVPDGCIDIIINLNENSYSLTSSIVGTMTKPIFAELMNHVNLIAVRFKPGGYLHFFDIPAYNLTDEILPFDAISASNSHCLIERLMLEKNINCKLGLLQNYLKNLLIINHKNDSAIKYVLKYILERKGNISISELSQNVNISQRQLCRKFENWIGVSPKSFCRIIRFQTTIHLLKNPNFDLLTTALNGGYYDQSHFIHEFSSLYGSTPSEFLKSRKNL
ncbi:MAG: helix-turn-helix transcriptional regulator [Sedimentisphaerales bacterium]|nr:helix-turn-helix transcriptional regulator [Sedimentisphaerales bacterium]